MYTVMLFEMNSWHMDGSPILIDDCGHRHRSLKAAHECLRKLYGYNHKTKTWSAKWSNAVIRHSDRSRLTDDEVVELMNLR